MKIIATRFVQFLLLSGLLYVPGSYTQEVAPGVWSSRNGTYRLSFTYDDEFMEAGVAYEWTLYILNQNRAPIEDATIEVHGYHPATRQILERSPIIGPYLGGGAYVVYNMYFQETGDWEVNVIITNGSRSDAVLIPVSL